MSNLSILRYTFFLLAALQSGSTALAQNTVPEIELRPGLVITQSCRVKSGTYRFAPKGDSLTALVRVAGRGISVDFQQAELRSTADSTRPDLFRGLAVEVEGADIQIKNLKIRGYKVGVLARPGTQGLLLDGVDASYNYRPRLLSGWAKEDERDWLSYHHNDQHEWLRYGAGIYLLGCTEATVRNCRVSACQNALLLDQSDNCLIYNNFFTFNSGLRGGPLPEQQQPGNAQPARLERARLLAQPLRPRTGFGSNFVLRTK
jgi:parallel beta-helix repeat protein